MVEEKTRAYVVETDTPVWLLIGSSCLLQDTARVWGGMNRGTVEEGRSNGDKGRSRSRIRTGCEVLREGDRGREHD